MPAQLLERPNRAPVPYVPGYSDTRQFTPPAPVAPGWQEQTAAIPQEDYRSGQRRHGIARRIASFVMNGRRRHANKQAPAPARNASPASGYAAPKAAPNTAPAASVTKAPERHVQAPTPKTSHLRYQRGVIEGTRPQEVVPVGVHQPLLTREQVNRQLGFEGIGDLQTVIHLPGAKEPLYCFKSSKDLGKGNVEVDYWFAMPQQFDRIRTATSQAAWDEVQKGMLHLNRINTGETKVSSDGTEVTVGRDHWLPGRPGKDHAENPGSNIPSGMEKVAGKQLLLRIDDTNNLVVQDLATPYDHRMDIDMTKAQPAAAIEVNPAFVPAQDEWSKMPINHPQGTTHYVPQ